MTDAADMETALKTIHAELIKNAATLTLWDTTTGRINVTQFNALKDIMSRLGALHRKLNLHKLIQRAQDAGKPLIGS